MKEINKMFHHLWTKAVGTQDYDKQEWWNLERKIKKELRILEEKLKRTVEKSICLVIT